MNQSSVYQGLFVRCLLLVSLLDSVVAGSAQAAIHNTTLVPDNSLTHPEIPADSIARNFGLWDDTETGGATTYQALTFDKGNFLGTKQYDCLGVGPHFHAQHVVRLPNKDGYAYFAVASSDSLDVPWQFFDDPRGRLSIYKSYQQVDPLTDLAPNQPGTDGQIVWEDVYDENWLPAHQYPVTNTDAPGWNHPGKMQVIGNLLLVGVDNWDGAGCDDGIGSSDDAVFFYDIRDPGNPVYWGSLSASELGLGEQSTSDITLIKVGDEYVLNIKNFWWTASELSPDISNWTRRGTGKNTSSHGSAIYSYEYYGRPPTLPSYGSTVPHRPGELRAMYVDGDSDICPNYVTGLEYLEFSTTCFVDPAVTDGYCWFAPTSPEQTVIAKRDTIYRAGPNLMANYTTNCSISKLEGGGKDYDGVSAYVTGGVPIIYTPLISESAVDASVDTIFQVYNPANQRRTLGQALNDTTLTWTTGGHSGWFAQLHESHDGDSAAKAGLINNDNTGVSNWLETTINGYGELTFWWKVATDHPRNTLSFTLDGQPVANGTITGIRDWAKMSVSIPETANGPHTLRWTYQNLAGNQTNFVEGAWVDEVAWNIPIPIALDDEARTWWKEQAPGNTSGFGGDWFGQSVTTHDGVDAAQSGAIGANESTWVRASFAGPGTVSFWWKVSSEPNGDKLRVHVPLLPSQTAEISGDIDWQQHKVLVPAGWPVYWTYVKNSMYDWWDDAGWIDQVVFTSSVVANTNDSGAGSLRDTIAGSGPGARITFDPSLDGQTILLASKLVIDEDLTIDASWLANGLTLSGGGSTLVMEIPAGRTVELNSLTIVDGSTSGEQPGGLFNAGTATVSNSTFSGNVGAILNNGVLTLVNSTLSGNDATPASLDGGEGGGLLNRGSATLIHTTITNNNALYGGGGIGNLGTLHLVNSIVAGNTSTQGSGPDIALWGGTITTAGANLIGNNETVAAVFPVSPPLVGEPGNVVNPLLAALADNGGPTHTHKPLAGSPAIDMATGVLPETDQRGIPRVAGSGDIGAVEVEELTAWNTQDSGAGSLRQTIADAAPGQTITFDAGLDGQVIDLAGSPLVITRDLTIDATSLPNGLTLDGNSLSRVLEVSSGQTVAIRGLEIRNGSSPSGGGVYNDGNLTLTDCTFDSNHANGFGGAVYNNGTATIDGCTFLNNTANTAGAVFNGIGRDLTVVNTTATGNHSVYNGGALMNYQGTVTVVHATIAGNTSDSVGAGIDNDAGTVTIGNSIVAGNTVLPSGSGADISNRSNGSIIPVGNNLIGDNDTISAVFPEGSLIGTPVSPLDPMLSGLGVYGGRTQTMPPFAGSPAIDAVAAAAGDPDTDQRNFPRPSGAASDLGAVEQLIAGNPGPAPGQSGVAYLPWLEWSGPPGASYEVFFDSGAGFVSLGQTTSTVWFINSPLALLTLHQWRIDTTLDGYTTTGPAWSFTTQGAIVTTSLDENDDGLGLGAGDSLREVIAAAPANSIITFDPALDGLATSLASELVIARNLTIDASGFANGFVLNGNNAHRIFTINSGVSASLTGLGIHSGSASSGGGIYNSGNLALTDCEFAGNNASVFGGAVYNNGTATIAGCTFLDNVANTAGAVYNGIGRELTLVNSTATGNHSVYNGGALMNNQGTATVVHVTLSGNTAGSAGAGIDNDTGTVIIENSIIAANSGPPPGTGADIANRGAGVILPAGNNLIGDNDTVSDEFPAGPLVGTTAAPVNPGLTPLGDYGGPTRTMSPLAGSPVIDAATDSSYWTGNIDQRGLPRPEGPGYDIGAVEEQYPDSDGDGIDDWYEISVLGTDPSLLDSDGDGLVDGTGELVATSTYPAGIDIDGDGFVDGELDLGTDPAISNLGDLAPRNSPDNLINLGDLLVLYRLVTRADLPSDLEKILGDINGDTQLNTPDILLLQKAILNGNLP